MMIKYIRPALTLLMLLTGYCACAQNAMPVQQTLDKLQQQATDFPFEKAYLHLDKPFYAAGDTIWFKGYVLIGAGHQLSGRSNVLDVELVNQRNAIIRSIKLPVIGGVTRGDIPLPDTLTEGSYRIRAYTNWMRNAGPDYYFEHTVSIINAVGNKVFTHTAYTYKQVNGQQTVNAIVNYTNADDVPYAGKEVKYEVQLNPKKVASGKGVTDDKGNLSVTFSNPSPGMLKVGQLITGIAIDNQQTVTKTIPIKATTAKVDVQFFPESGSLVTGIVSKVAFKAVGADGLGAAIKGTVVDDQNNEVTTFNSAHLGMGTFFLNPEPGKTYKAHMTYADSTKGIVDLPKALDKGYVMAIHADSANVMVKITGAGIDGQANGVTLVAQSGGEVYLQGKGSPGKSSFMAVIPRNKLPSGIIQFTLFADDGEPLNERLVFIQNPDKLNLNVSASQPSYAPRQKVKINLNAKGPNGQPVQGNFSIAVTDESKVPVDENSESTILSNILLTSDIKGYVEKPNYYFTNINPKTATDLDALMLTQGYHRYEWKQVMGNDEPLIAYQPEKKLAITGTLKNLDGKPLANSKITLLSKAGQLLVVDTTTDRAGRFVFNLDFKDSTKFALKAAAVNKDNTLMEMDKPATIAGANKNAPDIMVNLDAGMDAYIRNSKQQYEEAVKYHIGDRSTLLKQVNVKTERPKTEKEVKIQKAVEFSSNLNGKGMADQVVTSYDIDNWGCTTITDCFPGRFLGVTFDNSGNPHLLRANNSISLKTNMLIIIDGVQTQGSPLNTLITDIHDISSVEVLRSGMYTAIYGVRAAGGVMVITTKHGSGFVEDIKGDQGTITPQGYYKAREFYSPQYDNPKINAEIPDLRSTIYWKPILQTDKDGNASFEYFNADGKGVYRVVIEGVDYKTGALGRQVFTYKVE